ncbi:phage holin family protein [Weeksellaceae bacterium A-14]|uniref:phage holin family protein n=1 Tax=Daejeonia sp. YH14 TaxID=3439042 RepID=UPI0031E4A37D
MINIIKEYIEKRIDLLRLETTEKAAVISGLVYFLIIALIFLVFFIVFLILGLGLWIGYLLGNYSYGLFIMSGACLLMFFIIMALRKTIQKYAANTFIKYLNR